jgi:hypothetical protein
MARVGSVIPTPGARHDRKAPLPRHRRFVTEYLHDGNATQACIRPGYSARGAQSCASRLLALDHGKALQATRL